MGLFKDFKRFVSETMPEAVTAGEARGDVALIDVLCIVHAFRPQANGTPVLHQLVARLVAAAAPLCAEGSTLVVVFDRQSTTPQQKAATQAKRHKADRKYTGEEAIALLETDMSASEWDDILAERTVRSHIFNLMTALLMERFHQPDGELGRAARMMVHNGRTEGGPQLAVRGTEAWTEMIGEDVPDAGEADVAIAMWARTLLRDMPDARVVTLTVDSDLVRTPHLFMGCVNVCVSGTGANDAYECSGMQVPLMMLHGGKRSSVCLSHADQKHRLCVSTSVLAECVRTKYKLTPEEFVVVIVSLSTDFSPRCVSGIPSWAEITRLSAAFLRSTNAKVITNGALDITVFMRMIHSVSLYKKAAKVLLNTTEDKNRVEWVLRYWIRLEDVNCS